MPTPTQLIYTDQPGSLPATYVVPASSEITVSSIFARFDGGAASGSFVPTLDILSQSGALMARVAAQTTLAVGDSARVTWAPFLRTRQKAIIDIPIVGAAIRRLSTNPQSIPSSASANIVTFDTVDFDTASMWDAGSPTRLTCSQAGLYLISGHGSFVGNGTGDRSCGILENGGGELARNAARAPASFSWSGNPVGIADLAVGDYIELYVAQNSGGNLNTGLCNLQALGLGQVA